MEELLPRELVQQLDKQPLSLGKRMKEGEEELVAAEGDSAEEAVMEDEVVVMEADEAETLADEGLQEEELLGYRDNMDHHDDRVVLKKIMRFSIPRKVLFI